MQKTHTVKGRIMNSAFTAAHAGGNNFANSMQESRDRQNEARDRSSLDMILQEAMSTNDPSILQQTMGKILTSVSKERQPAALKVLENKLENLSRDKKRVEIETAYKNQGLDPSLQFLPPGAQSQIIRSKNPSTTGGLSGQPVPTEIAAKIPEILAQNRDASADDLAVALDSQGIPRAYSNSYIENRRRVDEARANETRNDKKEIRKYNNEISKDVLKENEKEAQSLIQSESALDLMETAISSRDQSFFSLDNLAELSGIEGLRSKEGALFKTAGKEFFLGNISRAGARPNQFIEKQVADMLPKIGRSTAANLSVTRAFRNENELKKEKIRLTRDLATDLEKDLGYVPKNIGQLRDEKLKIFAEKKQKELNNDLRAIKSLDEKNTQPYEKVEKGTAISKVVAKAILNQFKKDDPSRVKKAQKFAQDLGYQF